MVRNWHIIAALLLTVVISWAADKPYYRFPLVTDLHDSARVLVYDVFGGASSSRNITGSDINKPFRTYTGPLGRRIPAFQNLTGYVRKSAFSQFSAAIQQKLTNKVDITDSRLSDARLPLAHTQSISTITGLQTALDNKHDQSAHDRYSTTVALQLAGKEATGIASSLVVSHNANSASHSGHFTNTNNPHATTAAQVGAVDSSKFTNYSAHRQPEIAARKVFHGIQTAGTPTWATNVFTLPTSGGNITYWYQGNKYSGGSNITLALTPVANTLYFVSFDSANGQLSSSTSPWDLYTKVPVATVMVNAAGASSVVSELHDYRRSIEFHLWAHLSVGTRYITGGSLSGIGGSGTGVTWSISSTTIMDEDITHSLPAFTQANGARKFRQTASSAMSFEDTSYPFYWSGTNAQWVDAGFALQPFTSAQYINVFVYGLGDTTKPYWFYTPAIAAPYTSVANARAVAPPSLAGLGLNPEMKLMYRMVVSGGASPAIQAITTADDYRTSSTIPSGGTSVPNASNVSYAPYTSTKNWTNVQQAITEASRSIPQVCVDIYDGAAGATGATGAAGANGKNALFCNISAPVRAFKYDSSSTGLNPLPALQAFAVQLWNGASRIVAQTWTWWTGGSANHVYGSGSSSTFTPTVYTSYSGHTSNNFVAVQVKYSSAATGKQYCTTGTPIAVTKQGTTGPQGPQGSNATVTESSVISAFSAASDNPLIFTETSANTYKVKFKSNGFERFGITGSGKLTHMDTAGTIRFLYDPASHSLTVYSGSGTAIFKTWSAHRTSFYTRSGNKAMTIYSSGRVVIGG